MLSKIIKYFLSIVFLTTSVFGQTATDVLKKVSEKMNSKEKFEYQLKYNLYKGHTSSKVFQTYDGFFQKRDVSDYYMQIDDAEIIMKNTFNLKINHKEKAMALYDEDKVVPDNQNIELLTQVCKINTFKKSATGYEITLIPGQFSGLYYSKIVLYIGLNHFLKKQVFYYNSQMDFSKNLNDTDLEYPRLEILCYSLKNSLQVKKPVLNDFVTITGKKISPKTKYKSYQISDLRK